MADFTRGFGWVIGDRKRSPRNTHECLVLIGVATDAAVDKLIRRALDASAKIVMEAGNQKWGYAGAFADLDGHMWQVTSPRVSSLGRRGPSALSFEPFGRGPVGLRDP